MKTEEIDFRTPLQIERDNRNLVIWEDYKALVEQNSPNFTTWAACRILGQKHELAPEGIRSVLKKMRAKNEIEKNT